MRKKVVIAFLILILFGTGTQAMERNEFLMALMNTSVQLKVSRSTPWDALPIFVKEKIARKHAPTKLDEKDLKEARDYYNAKLVEPEIEFTVIDQEIDLAKIAKILPYAVVTIRLNENLKWSDLPDMVKQSVIRVHESTVYSKVDLYNLREYYQERLDSYPKGRSGVSIRQSFDGQGRLRK